MTLPQALMGPGSAGLSPGIGFEPCCVLQEIRPLHVGIGESIVGAMKRHGAMADMLHMERKANELERMTRGHDSYGTIPETFPQKSLYPTWNLEDMKREAVELGQIQARHQQEYIADDHLYLIP